MAQHNPGLVGDLEGTQYIVLGDLEGPERSKLAGPGLQDRKVADCSA